MAMDRREREGVGRRKPRSPGIWALGPASTSALAAFLFKS